MEAWTGDFLLLVGFGFLGLIVGIFVFTKPIRQQRIRELPDEEELTDGLGRLLDKRPWRG